MWGYISVVDKSIVQSAEPQFTGGTLREITAEFIYVIVRDCTQFIAWLLWRRVPFMYIIFVFKFSLLPRIYCFPRPTFFHFRLNLLKYSLILLIDVVFVLVAIFLNTFPSLLKPIFI